MSNFKFSTDALHAGHDPKTSKGSLSVPLYQTISYVFKDSDQAAGAFDLSIPIPLYTRLNNPTNGVLEQRLATLEGGAAGVATASGQAAISTTLLTLLKSGEHIVSASSLYGGTFNLFNVTLPRFGINTSFVDASDPENFRKNIQDNTKAIFVESLGNPKLDVIDLEAIAKIAQEYKIPFIVDNTVATPYLLNPIKYGANVVVHSLTKYIGGNGTSLGGAIIDAGNFDWASADFPEMTEPSKGYHGLIFSEVFGKAALTGRLVAEGLRDFGAALSPFNGHQLLQGLETLPLRIKKQSENALALAQWLEEQEEVAWVNYPGLKSSKYYTLAQKYLPEGQSGVLTFGLKGGYKAGKKVADETSVFSLMANFGDSKSLVIHPASTTHQQLTEEEQQSAGVTSDLIRLSIGIEDIEDLKADLKSTF